MKMKSAKKTPSKTLKNQVQKSNSGSTACQDSGPAKEAVLPTRPLLQPRVLDFSTPSWFKAIFLAFLFFLLFQLLVGGCRFAGKAADLYRQYREFQQWRQNVLPPNPFRDDERSGIRDFLKRHFPRRIDSGERAEASRVFTEAAQMTESGELASGDDLFGYLAENLRPVCRDKAWPEFLDGVWDEIEGEEGADLTASLQAVADALAKGKKVLMPEAVAEAVPEPEKTETPTPAEHSEGVKALSRNSYPSYGGYRWW